MWSGWAPGTTGRPKGVLTTHTALTAQITDLVSSWEWSSEDHILHFLPLHHVHGVVNKLACALWSGAMVEFIPWGAKTVWDRLMSANDVTVFMAVPTVRIVSGQVASTIVEILFDCTHWR